MKMRDLKPGQYFHFPDTDERRVFGSTSPCGTRCSYWYPFGSDWNSFETSADMEIVPVSDFDPPMVTGVENCARCGGNHSDLRFFSFGKEPEQMHDVYQRWAICPESGNPILMIVQDVK